MAEWDAKWLKYAMQWLPLVSFAIKSKFLVSCLPLSPLSTSGRAMAQQNNRRNIRINSLAIFGARIFAANYNLMCVNGGHKRKKKKEKKRTHQAASHKFMGVSRTCDSNKMEFYRFARFIFILVLIDF